MAQGFANEIVKKVRNGVGSSVYLLKTITSSSITTSAVAITGAATGRFYVKQIIAKTDSTGLAGGTNFTILSNNAKGIVNIFVEAISGLGANITKSLTGATAADTTTSDAVATVTALPTVLEAGKVLQVLNTSSVGTGAGTVDLMIELIRLDEGATISVV